MYAQRVVDRITRRSEQITKFPGSGRMVPEYEAPDVREVIERPFAIIYRVKADTKLTWSWPFGAQRLPPILLDRETHGWTEVGHSLVRKPT